MHTDISGAVRPSINTIKFVWGFIADYPASHIVLVGGRPL